jgi:hypothetical protein
VKNVRQADLLRYLLENLCPIENPTMAWLMRERYRRVRASGDYMVYTVFVCSIYKDEAGLLWGKVINSGDQLMAEGATLRQMSQDLRSVVRKYIKQNMRMGRKIPLYLDERVVSFPQKIRTAKSQKKQSQSKADQ